MPHTLSTPRSFTPGDTPIEKYKMEKDGIDVLEDIYRYAKTGFASITHGDFDLMKWYGIYRQKPNDSGYFMMRLRIPGGQLNAAQMETIAALVRDYGHGFGDITTRQAIQMHWIRIENVTAIFEKLQTSGLTTFGACGDITRNIAGCPIAGADPDELIDVTPVIQSLNDHFVGNREFSNLPRKLKMSVCGCRLHCAQPDINCVGFFAMEREKNGKREVGFGVKVGGGLSTAPHLAQTLPIFIRPDEVTAFAHGIATVFRDFGPRQSRNKVRLKFLVADLGADKLLAHVEKVLNKSFERHENFVFPEDPETDHLGIHPQKQPGLFYAGISVAGGRVRSGDLFKVAELAKTYCAPSLDSIRTTNKQNLILLNIPEKNIAPLKAAMCDAGLVWAPSVFRRGCVSCTGMEFCNLALAETKNRMVALISELENECSFFDHENEKIRIHFSGCPSSCGQHQIADIGFRGGRTQIGGIPVECFDLFVGGKLGDKAKFSTQVKGKIPAAHLASNIRRVLEFYTQNRQAGESFSQFAARHDKSHWVTALA